MDLIMGWFQQMFSSAIWHNLFQNFRGVDYFTVIFLIVGFVYGAKQGLMREIGEVIEVLIVLYVTIHLYESAVSFMKTISKQLPLEWAKPTAFFVIMAVVWLIILIIDTYGRKMMHTQMIAPIRVLGGAALGTIHSMLIMSVVCFGLALVPIRGVKNQFDNGQSITGPLLIKVAPAMHEFLIDQVEKLSEKTKEILSGESDS